MSVSVTNCDVHWPVLESGEDLDVNRATYYKRVYNFCLINIFILYSTAFDWSILSMFSLVSFISQSASNMR